MRDKNKLKRLLTILIITGLTIVPAGAVASVVACGTTQKGDNNANDTNDISTIKDDLQSLVDAEDKNDKAWDLTELQNEKLGGTSDNKDKTLTQLGITVTDTSTLSGTSNSDKVQKLTFAANGMSYSGSQEIVHNYTETTFTPDNISVIEADLKALVESKTDSMWETTGENSILNQTLGGSTEYKDKTLSELGIDVECLNSDAQPDENGLITEYNFQFTVNDSSTYLIAGTKIDELTQNVLSPSKTYYSIYLDVDGNKVASNSIPDGATEVLYLGTNADGTKFVSIPNSVTKVTIGDHGDKITSLSNAFATSTEKTNLEYVDFTGFDSSNVINMTAMFQNCALLKEIKGLENLNTSKVDDLSNAFFNCSSLTSLDLSSWDTSKVTNMYATFSSCSSLTSLDLSGWNMSNATNMYFTFYGCSSLTSLDLSSWDTSKVTTIRSMFSGCSSLTALDLSNWDFSLVTNYTNSFYGCSKLECPDLSGWKVSNDFDQLDFISSSCFADLINFSTSKAPGLPPEDKTIYSRYIDADGNEQECYWNIPDGATEVLYLGTNEAGTKFVSIPDSVTKVTIGDHGDKITSLYWTFDRKSNLETIDFTDFDSSNVTNMASAFQNCYSLKEIKGLENLNTSKVTDISYMFEGCTSLTNIEGMENWDMSSLTSYELAFAVNYDADNDEPIDGQDVSLNCPNLSEWKVSEDFDQSDFISSTKFDKLKDYNSSQAPGQSN